MSKPPVLAGRRIAVTRAREQAPELTAKLTALGAEVVELPLIQVSKQIEKDHPLAYLEQKMNNLIINKLNEDATELFVSLFPDDKLLGCMDELFYVGIIDTRFDVVKEDSNDVDTEEYSVDHVEDDDGRNRYETPSSEDGIYAQEAPPMEFWFAVISIALVSAPALSFVALTVMSR